MSFKISLTATCFHIFINSLGLYLSPEYVLNFLSNLYISLCVGNIFKFIVFTFLENALNLIILVMLPFPTQNSRSSYHQTLGRGKLLIPPGSISSQIFFPQQQKRVKKTMVCSIRIQSETIKMTWNVSLFVFCLIFNVLNVMVLQFCK